MAYVDKKEALRYLSNPNDFNIYKNMFIKLYDKDLINKIKQTYNDLQYKDLYDIINNINKISLNIGSNILFELSKELLESIDKENVDSNKIVELLETIDMVNIEIRNIK